MPLELTRGVTLDNYKPTIPCTVLGCPRSFRSKDDLWIHVMNEPDHFTCDDCDYSCIGWENWLNHITTSKNHIACPSCGKQYGSEGGLKRHIRHMHQTPQKIKCPGCTFVTQSVGSLMLHLEDGGCPGIQQQVFHDHVNHKHIITNLLHPGSTKNLMSVRAEDDTENTTNATSDAASEAGGGVGIWDLMSNGADDTSAWGSPNTTHSSSSNVWNTLQPEKTPTTDTFSKISKGVSTMSLVDYESSDDETDGTTVPSISPNVKANLAPSTSQKPAAFAAALQHRQSVYNQQRPDTSRQASIHAGANIHPVGHQAEEIGKKPLPGNKFNTRYWSPRSEYWDVENFFNTVINRYECPHPGCDWLTPSANELRRHCLTKHRPVSYRCPSCMREFRDLSALVRHCETVTERCNIRDSKNFAKFMDQITGGYIDASRTDSEGKIQYTAKKPRDFEDKLDSEQGNQIWNAEFNGESGDIW